MIKTIGKKILFFLMLIFQSCFIQNSQLILTALSTDEEMLSSIQTNKPFYLRVQAKNMGSVNITEQSIPSSPSFNLVSRGASQKTTIINGKREDETVYNFVTHATKEGKFSFGPIIIRFSNGTEIASNKITLTVSDQPLVHKNNSEPFIFKTSLDKQKVFVGEKILLRSSFYYRQNIEQLTFERPECKDFLISATLSSASVSSMKNIDGYEYRCEESTIAIYPQTAGVFNIAPARVEFFKKAQQSKNSLSSFFGNLFAEQFEMYSNATEVEVLPLPKHPDGRSITAVGIFDRVVLSIKDNSPRDVGQGLTATYEIVGEGNLELIPSPKLDLPVSIRSYFSTQSIDKIKDEQKKKSFEMIIQGNEPGTFIIPAQKFEYFDLKLKQYKTLLTEPQTITFTGKAIAKKDEQLEQRDFSDQAENIYQFKDGQIQNICSDYTIFTQARTGMRDHTFFMWLLFFMVILFMYAFLILFFLSFNHLNRFVWFQKRYVLWKLYFLKYKENAFWLHRFFEMVFDFQGVDLYDNSGIALWKRIRASESDTLLWKKYIEQLNQAVYMNNASYNYQELYQEAREITLLLYKQIGREKMNRE